MHACVQQQQQVLSILNKLLGSLWLLEVPSVMLQELDEDDADFEIFQKEASSLQAQASD